MRARRPPLHFLAPFLGPFFASALFSGVAGAQPPTPVLATHDAVTGTEIKTVDLAGPGQTPFHSVAWADLSNLRLAPGDYQLRLEVTGGDHVALEIPVCSGRSHILLDGAEIKTSSPAPLVVKLPTRPARAYEAQIGISVGSYEHRIACGSAPRFGAATTTREGTTQLSFSSPSNALGGGHAVVFVPPGHDLTKATPVLIGLHPWNGSPWTYAAYAELIREAATKDVVLLMPSGLGNSLYTADAEEEVFRALAALQTIVNVGTVSLWGASMGGAGATTIGFHNPDRFASVTSFFGDSKYDIATYVKSILPTEAAAHAVNALDIVENARNMPVWLIHGEDDHVSPIAQSTMLARALQDRGFSVQLDRVPKSGHEGAVVAKYIGAVVDRAALAKVDASPAHVTYRSVRAKDTEAYGVRFVRSGGDAFIDLERRGETVHVLQVQGVKSIELQAGAFGLSPHVGSSGTDPVIVHDGTTANVDVRWVDLNPVSLDHNQ